MLYFSPLKSAGYLPLMLNASDPRSVQEQLNESYAHGGGWNSFSGFTLVERAGKYALSYPDDPLMTEVSRAQFRDQLLVLFQSAWLGIIEDGKLLDVARVD